MSSTAVIFMVVAMVLIWGGLLASAIHLVKNPDIPLEEVE